MNNQGFNFTNAVSDTVSTNAGNFGLNTNCHFNSIEFITNAGKDGAKAEAFDININIDGKEYRRRIFNPEESERLYLGGDSYSQGEEGYQEVLGANLKQATAMIVHAIKATGVAQEEIETAVNKFKPNSFAAFSQTLLSIMPPTYREKPIDVFLQYQWQITGDNSITFLELPKNMKQGYWVVPSTPNTKWKEVKDNKGLHYVNDKGEKHAISKSANFLESNFAIQQKADRGSIDNSNHTHSEW